MPGLSWGIGPVGVSYNADGGPDNGDNGQGIGPVVVSYINNTPQVISGCVGPGQHQTDGEILS